MIVSFNAVSKSFGAHNVLSDISAKLEDQDRVGLVGPNGAGKSTLLNLIYGDLEADSGELARADVSFGFLRQNSGLSNENTIIEEMRLAFAALLGLQDSLRQMENEIARMDTTSPEYHSLTETYAAQQSFFEQQGGYQIDVRIQTVLNGMGFGTREPSTPVSVLSGGEKTRLALCKLLLEEPKLLILDEPTNHLDFKTLLWLEDYLASWQNALLIVSHDRYFLDKLCRNIWEVDRGHLFHYKGNYTKYVQLKAERQDFQQKEYDKQQQEIDKMKDFVARNIVRASTTGRAQARQKALDKMELVDRPLPPIRPAKMEFHYQREPVKDVLHIKDLALSVQTSEGEKELCKQIELDMLRGEKIALIGANGVGKTTMLKALQKLHPHKAGSILWGQNVQVSYFEQGDLELEKSKTVLNALWDLFPREYEHTIRTILGNMQIVGENVYKQVGNLSGGERARLKFAIMLLKNGNVLLMDEPTNHLDLGMKESLDTALQSFEGTVLAVSHDRYLLNKFPTKIAEMHHDHIRVYKGNYDAYLRQKEWESNASTPAVEAPTSAPRPAPAANAYFRSKKSRSDLVAKRKLLASLEKEIEELEANIVRLEQSMLLPEVSGDYQLLQQHCEELEQSKDALNERLAEWMPLGDELAALQES